MASKIDPAVDKELKAIRKQIQDLDKKFVAAHNEQGKRYTSLHNELLKAINDLDKKYAAAINERH